MRRRAAFARRWWPVAVFAFVLLSWAVLSSPLSAAGCPQLL